MPHRRTFLICTGISVLFHVVVLWLAYLLPEASPRREEVMEIEVADIPRSADFLPPKPGIIEGRKPRAAAPPVRRETARRESRPADVMEGRVPDLPVKPDLPPEKSFPAPLLEEEPPRTARAGPQEEEPPAPAKKESSPGAGSPRSLRDLTPSLGKLVMAREEPSGGRGQAETSGSAVGTGGKSTGKEGITEEGGGGFRLTPLNAPEVQYISYFASIKRKIELVWQYPFEAAAAGAQGELLIDFVIGRNGKLESAELVRGSGHKILDDEALRSIRKASPFDPIPNDYKIPNLQIRGRFVYVHGGALRLR
ncbi:MAG: energy transducer TonB [Deltaproteobacteria bacterium]|nr:energy transducer TonB [Deltaproteobacteria bacterium]